MQIKLNLAEIRNIYDLYQTLDIFNINETAFTYKASPDSFLFFKIILDSKLKKERITINFYYNVNNT
jgi:hypothetical protein